MLPHLGPCQTRYRPLCLFYQALLALGGLDPLTLNEAYSHQPQIIPQQSVRVSYSGDLAEWVRPLVLHGSE